MANITLKIMGGIGNQMFQYATVYCIAKRNNWEVIIDISSYEGYIWRERLDFTLDVVKKDIKIKNYNLHRILKRYSNSSMPFKHLLSKVLLKFLGNPKSNFIEKKEFSYDRDLFQIKEKSVIEGYFQSYLYFEENKREICEIYKRFPLSSKGNSILESIRQKGLSVAVHYRDYSHLDSGNEEVANYMGILEKDYYKNAMGIICKKELNAKFFIFSNNINQSKTIFDALGDIEYVEYQAENEWDDMMLMSQCTHNIIANSSYSWWSAYLNSNPNKIVIAPKSWGNLLKGRENDNDLFPKDWILI